MRVSELVKYGASEQLIKALENQGIQELYQPQALAVKAGLLFANDSFVIAAPTASGKTLVSEMRILKTVLEERGKALYLVPLRALASEKFEDFSEKYAPLGIKVAMTTGELDSADPWLGRYDIVFVTNEKMDSLIRHQAPWINEVSLVVADEIHLLVDPHRGPTLEVVLARLRQLNPNLRILALSATIKNAREIADWLEAKLIESTWRPVVLREGVCYGQNISFNDGTQKEIKLLTRNDAINLALNTIEEGGQALIFVNTRRATENIAELASGPVSKVLSLPEKRALEGAADEILKALPEPTRICKKLADAVRSGVGFHHAGLHSKQKKIVENNFRANKLKLVIATPTLAMGLNLPSRRVIIRDWLRYEPAYGMTSIPVLEIKQMCLPYSARLLIENGELVPIGEIVEEKMNKKVFSFDHSQGKFTFKKISGYFLRETYELIEIQTNEGPILQITSEHPVLVKEGGWIPAGDLGADSKIGYLREFCYFADIGPVRWLNIKKLKKINGKFKVYNISVEDTENYVADNFILHNCGRAGRPKFDRYGEAVLIAKSQKDQEFLFENYIQAEPEKIWSKLANEAALRTHVLASIATLFTKTKSELWDFVDKTFFAKQYDPATISNAIENILQFLEEEAMIERRKGKLIATDFGRRVAQLYIDPSTGVVLRDALRIAEEKIPTHFSFLHAICHTPDMQVLYLRRGEHEKFEQVVLEYKDEFLFPIPDSWRHPSAYELFIAETKTAEIFQDWINESREDDLVEKYGIGPGDIRALIGLGDWLLYSLQELGKIFKTRKSRGLIATLRKRVIYGVRNELLELVALENIGRIRARNLYRAGYKTLDQLKEAKIEELAKVPTIGPGIALRIKKQLGEEVKPEIIEEKKLAESRQTSIFNFE
ncbi:MAG: DEAD/DEAH box helicase [Euryarchaeota archaeon]|nr:DEAD/DEAH box helicase [Euryarchaeota archaeon]